MPIERGISSLPTQTRTVLVQYYLESIPQAEIAARLGTTVEAVEARIRRGKRALGHLLTHELREEAASFGFITAESITWQHTRIWCPICGQRQLLTRLPEPPGTVSFRCPGCNDDPEGIGWAYALSNPHFVQRLAGLTQPVAAQYDAPLGRWTNLTGRRLGPADGPALFILLAAGVTFLALPRGEHTLSQAERAE